MRLHSLKIIGFKSFADRITIEFDCDIVAIVGPNGCGKSNIVDAFRWVMGEQSAKSMRGEKMFDVLFAGTDHRKALNMAEVSVTLTDVAGELPIDYNEVTITRRLYRSGESLYLINRQPVRMRDVQDLLLGSGVGKNTFSIFEQGKLDQVIHLAPKERRTLFDEAAGIGRFLQRKKETLRRLASVSENYTRIHDLHLEVERQTKQLKRQAVQAKSFQENKKRLEELEKALLISKLRTLIQKSAKAQAESTTLSEQLAETDHRLIAVETNFEAKHQQMRALQEEAKAKERTFQRAETEVKILQSEKAQKCEQQRELEVKNKRHAEERCHIEKELKDLDLVLKECQSEYASAEHKKEAAQEALEQERERYDTSAREVEGLRLELKKMRANHLASLEKERHLQTLAQESKSQREALEMQIESQTAAGRDLQVEISEKKREAEKEVRVIDALKSDGDSAEKALETCKEKSQDLEKVKREWVGKLTELEARKQALTHLKLSHEGFSKGAKRLLQAIDSGLKPLSEALTFERPEFAKARHFYAQTLVASCEKTLKEALQLARSNGWSDFSLVLKSKVKALLKGVERAPNLEAARKQCTEAFTDEGYFVDTHGVIFHLSSERPEGDPFLREAEIHALEVQLIEIRQQLAQAEKKLEKQNALHEKLYEEHRVLSERWRRQEMGLMQINVVLQRARVDLERGEKALQKLQKLLASQPETQEVELEYEKREAISKELLVECQNKEAAVEKKELALAEDLKTWQAFQGRFQLASSDYQQKRQALDRASAQIKERKSLLEQLSRAQTQGLEELVEIEKSLGSIEAEIERATQRLEEERADTSSADGALSDLEMECEALAEATKKLRQEKREIEQHFHKLEIGLAEENSHRRSIEQELRERHHLSCDQWENFDCSALSDEESAEREVRRLRVAVEQSGSVNLAAIDTYQEQMDRFNEIQEQLDDLESSKRDLEQVIQALDKQSRSQFKETFEAIRSHFQRNFALLFDGGEANLTFTESPDVLEAGIEITAKPPGKQMRSISLLSGGEKCLTALALLFSIFEVRPAPFCILDEVDAPLDDTNIGRFTEVLKQFVNKTQFIIVTHNKKTMSIAELLLGVSMEEKGVSKLLTLSFQQSAMSI